MEKESFLWDGEVVALDADQTIEQRLDQDQWKSDDPVLLLKVNDKILDLKYTPKAGDVVESLRLSTSDGWRAYQRGLMFMFIRAVKKRLPKANVWILHSFGPGLYCEIENAEVTPFLLDEIGRIMREYVNENVAFELNEISKTEAIDHYENTNQLDKARLLAYREKDYFKIYRFGEMRDYFYGYMPPSTQYIQRFLLNYEMPGIGLLQPAQSDPSAEITVPKDPKLLHVYRQSEQWAQFLDCTTVADLNDMATQGKLQPLIMASEAEHNKEITDFAAQICEWEKRLVVVAGPSSSGKTTFTQRLRYQLQAKEKRPMMISLDNYYMDRDKIPQNEDGSVDLEHINTLRLDLFNEHLVQLLAGETVQLPRFDFTEARSIEDTGNFVRLEKDAVLLVEGIHGLNDELTAAIPRSEKFKIYISALTQLNLDKHNRIPTTDVRLLRRMVRDFSHRNSTAEETLRMWPSVLQGEKRWIFPYQERCDVMFNSTLMYELLYLKVLAQPLLKDVPENSSCFSEANRLLKFLNYFVPPPEDCEVPNTSIVCEFIGGGLFEQ